MSLLRGVNTSARDAVGRFRRTRGNALLLVDGPEVSPFGSSQFQFCQPHSIFSWRGSYLATVEGAIEVNDVQKPPGGAHKTYKSLESRE